MEVLDYFSLSEILELQDISEEDILKLLIKEGLINLEVYPFVAEMEVDDED